MGEKVTNRRNSTCRDVDGVTVKEQREGHGAGSEDVGVISWPWAVTRRWSFLLVKGEALGGCRAQGSDDPIYDLKGLFFCYEIAPAERQD